MIHVQDLTKEFKTYRKREGFGGAFRSLFSSEYTVKKAVDGISFDIAPGELVGYIGVNGAGKSTTIKMMTGILTPSSGVCEVFGLECAKNRKRNAKNIGVVFGQRSQLWWDLPVSESFGILRRIYEIPKARYDANLSYFKTLLDLDEFYLTPVRNLSLGQKMRADFAAAMLHDPKVLFLDEPTIGLDLVVKERIRKAIKDINARNGTTVILTTHDLVDIEEICDRIIVIDSGRKLFDGSIDDLKDRFGRIRSLRFETRGRKADPAFFTRADAGLDVSETDTEAVVKFPRNAFQVADLISEGVKAWDVRDIAIEEPQMEDIVREIYTGNLGLR